MKKEKFLGLALLCALAVLGAACGGGAANNSKNAGNQAGMNHNAMDHGTMDHSSMDHNSMPMNSNVQMNHAQMTSDANAASAPFDLQFIDTMSAHHQGAIEMAEMALRKTGNAELKNFAQRIVDDQKRENAQMKEWREKWFAGAPPAKNMEMSGMMDSMKMMSGDGMKKMEAASGTEFDLMFLEMMIPHHQGAVAMAREALQKSGKPEIKTLAEAVIKAQESEIKQMTDWKAKWKK